MLRDSSESEKTVFYNKLTAVEFKPPTITSGYLQLLFSGSRDATGTMFDLIRDENTVMFSAKEQPIFEAARAFIEEKIRQTSSPVQSQFSGIEQLAALREKGLITEEEFTAKKKQILGL
jgi:hypothetical protein